MRLLTRLIDLKTTEKWMNREILYNSKCVAKRFKLKNYNTFDLREILFLYSCGYSATKNNKFHMFDNGQTLPQFLHAMLTFYRIFHLSVVRISITKA